MTFFEQLFEKLTTIPEVLLTGSPEEVIVKVGGVLLVLLALLVLSIRTPISKELPPSLGLIMIFAGVLFWGAALVIIVTALGTVDFSSLLGPLGR